MKLEIDPDELRPVIKATVAEVLSNMQRAESKFDGRFCLSESEAAAALGVEPHVLRDCRRRGELRGRRIGKKIHYAVDELRRFALAK